MTEKNTSSSSDEVFLYHGTIGSDRELVVLPGHAPGSYAYKASALLLSYRTMEIPARFELAVGVLQTHALPLGYGITGSGSGSRTPFRRLMRPLEMPICYPG